MKKLKMLMFLTLIFAMSCSDDDNSNYDPNTTILNEWTLVKATGTIAGITHEFPNGMIIWKFNPNNTVTITNNNTDENLQSGLPSGTYSYLIENNPADAKRVPECAKKITINITYEFRCLKIDDTQMEINEGFADGINYHFEKVMPFTTN